MIFSRFLRKPANKTSYKIVPPFDMFYQLTYMSAMAAAGITRAKTFELAAKTNSSVSVYFIAINRLVDEFRYDYPDACRIIGLKAPSENMRSFLLRLSDALRSGEPLADYLDREAHIQAEDYENTYERNLEALKQWTNAFTSIVISVALIVIIQVITSMIYSSDLNVMMSLVSTGIIIAGFGAWIIWRSAPQENMIVNPAEGSPEQRLALRLIRVLGPVAMASVALLNLMKVDVGPILILVAVLLLPVGVISIISDKKTTKKDDEFSTFLRSTGGMATSTGTTLNEALGKIDLTSFPTLEPDIQRLLTRLKARLDPAICWQSFGLESGSRLINEVTAIFFSAIQIGGEPERVGYLCSIFAAKTSQLRAKRRLAASTFAGLTTVMQAVVAGLMVFVLSIVVNFAELVKTLMPTSEAAENGQSSLNMGMANFSPEELAFLGNITGVMVITLAVVGAAAIILGAGGYRLKVAFYLALTLFISGICYIVVPPLVDGILTI